MSAIPRLHLVTDDATLERSDVVAVGGAILESSGGQVALHIRGPGTSGRRIYELAAALTAQCGPAGLFVNDRVDVALALGLGVHLGARSLPVATVRSLIPSTSLVGRSVREDAKEGGGADFLFAGPVFDSRSHPALPGRGGTWLGSIAAGAEAPVLGIGGISADRIGVLLDAGAHGVAVIRAVWEAPDPVRAADDLRTQLYASP